MSDTLTVFAQEIIAQLPATFAGRYAVLSAAVLVNYDIFLTFSYELQHIWDGKLNTMKILFLLNRYSSLIYLYGVVLLEFIKSETNTAFFYISEIFNALTDFVLSAIFTLRTYAIYGRSRTVLILLATPAFLNLSSSIWNIVTLSAVALPPELQIGPLTCGFGNTSTNFAGKLKLSLLVISTSSHLKSAEMADFALSALFDLLVVILTVYRTTRLVMQSRKLNISGGLSFILLRDGMLHYSVIFIPQFISIVLQAIVLKTGNPIVSDISNTLTLVNTGLEIVIVNRLILNLSHAANTREDSEFRTRTGLEPPTFAAGPVLGNIGGPVRTFLDELDDEMLQFEGGERAEADKAECVVAEALSSKANGATGTLNGITEIVPAAIA